jgi:hypothetical protein
MYNVEYNYKNDLYNSFNFNHEHEAKHFAVDLAYEGAIDIIVKESFLNSTKWLYRVESFGKCFAVVSIH